MYHLLLIFQLADHICPLATISCEYERYGCTHQVRLLVVFSHLPISAAFSHYQGWGKWTTKQYLHSPLSPSKFIQYMAPL